MALASKSGLATSDSWAATLAKASESVVSLQLANLRNFDDSQQGGSNATGFVVDAEKGIILTNRHVVGTGPIRLSATFQNQERVDVVPLYRDPIHDFAFLRYNPADLVYANPHSLPLRPDKVSTGLNIRVIGSDGGEQLSILTGTIARLDRQVPTYGRYGYNDFNTFYFQAASSTSGGSSGSPVIDFDGDVVALNAAANTRTASSFFLPLPRIVYALERLQSEQKIDRGGFQTIFSHEPFRDLRRLGLDKDMEDRVRAQDISNNGMLFVRQVIAGGVADNVLQEGDVLISMNEQLITNFIELAASLDANISNEMQVVVMRQGAYTTLSVPVADLHQLEPTQYLELGDAILQNMSIQHSRAMDLPQSGVVVTSSGYLFNRANLAQGSVIIELDGMPVTRLEDFVRIVSSSSRDKKLLARYVIPGKEHSSSITQIDIDNRWFNYRLCNRVDNVAYWDCEAVDFPERLANKKDDAIAVPAFKDELLNKVAPAIVRVDFNIPYAVDNVYARHFNGVGLVVDKELGIVVVDRNTVPNGLGDAEITFFGSQVINASVEFLHPRHNIALLKYNPEELNDVEFSELVLADGTSELPESLTMIGYRADGTFRKSEFDDFSRLTVGFATPGLARFQQSSIDLYGVSNVPPSLGGPFVDDQGVVHAAYMSFAYEEEREVRQQEWAMPATVINETLRMYKSGRPYYSTDAQLTYRSISTARQLGLPSEWLRRYNNLPAQYRKVLFVTQVVPDTDADTKLLPGDIILAIEGELVSDLLQAEIAAQKESIVITVLRAGNVIDVDLLPSKVSGTGTTRFVSWAGAQFQEPHGEIGFLKGVNYPGVYISGTEQGSPALWDGLYRNRFVTHVDGVPVDDLDGFLSLVKQKNQDEVTRLSVVSISGRRTVVTVAPEYNFWPTFELVRSSEGWQRNNYTN